MTARVRHWRDLRLAGEAWNLTASKTPRLVPSPNLRSSSRENVRPLSLQSSSAERASKFRFFFLVSSCSSVCRHGNVSPDFVSASRPRGCGRLSCSGGGGRKSRTSLQAQARSRRLPVRGCSARKPGQLVRGQHSAGEAAARPQQTSAVHAWLQLQRRHGRLLPLHRGSQRKRSTLLGQLRDPTLQLVLTVSNLQWQESSQLKTSQFDPNTITLLNY